MLKYIFIFFPFSFFAQAWVKLSDFPGSKRDDGVAIVINGMAYVGTGVDQFGATGDFNAFDLSTFQWSAIQTMPNGAERQYAVCFGNDTCFFVSTGLGNSGALSSTYRYSLIHKKWWQVASKPGAGLMSASCLQFNNKVIIVGGKGNNDVINHQVWEYDISTDVWQQKSNFPFSPLWRSAYTTLNGAGYVLGGVDSLSRFSKKLYRYFHGSDQWLLFDSLPLARGRAYQAMQAVNNRLFVFGGFDSLNVYHNDAFIYDEMAGKWYPAPALPAAPRKGGMSFGAGQHFYYTCGIFSNNERQAETWQTDVPTALFESTSQRRALVYFDAEALKLRTSDPEMRGQLTVVDMSGRSICLWDLNETTKEMDVSGLRAGLYTLVLRQANGYTETFKLMR